MIRKLLALFLVLAALTCTAWADDGDNPDDDDDCNGENPDPCKCEDPKPCHCPNDSGGGGDGPSNRSLGYRINFGGVPFEPDLEQGVIVIHQETPTPTQFTPQVVRYASIFSSRIVSKKTDTAEWQVVTINPSSRRKTFTFAPGQSVAYNSDKSLALRLLNASRSSQSAGQGQAQPAYARLEYGDGSWTELDFASGLPLYHRSSTGRLIDLAALPEAVKVKLVEQDGVIRQIKAAAGLVDLVAIAQQQFEIRLYKPSSVGAFDTATQRYIVTGSPYRVLRVENASSSATEYGRVKISEIWGTRTMVSNFLYNGTLKQWQLTTGDTELLREEVKNITPGPGSNETTTTRTLKNEAGQAISVHQMVHRVFPWGKSVVRDIREPATLNLVTSIAYHETAGTAGYSKRKSREKPDGSWEYWTYDTDGRVLTQLTPWKDSSLGQLPTGPRVTVENSYVSLDAGDVVGAQDSRPRTVTESIVSATGVAPVVTKRTWYVYRTDSAAGVYSETDEQAASSSAIFGAAGNFRTTNVYYTVKSTQAGYSPLTAGRRHYVDYPDGRRVTYTYSLNASDPAAYFTVNEIFATAAAPEGLDGLSARTEKIHDIRGHLVTTRQYVRSGGQWQLVSTEQRTVDGEGFLIATHRNGRQIYAAAYDAHLLVSRTGEDGVTSSLTYDKLEKIDSETRLGVAASGAYAAQPDIVTTYLRELGGLDCGCDGETTAITSAGSLSLEAINKKDAAGRVVYRKETSGLVTTYSYGAGGRQVTRTNPDGGTVTELSHLDGRLQSSVGTGTIAQYQDYGVNADGTTWTKVSKLSAAGDRWEKTTTNHLGQVVKVERPAYDGGVLTRSYVYNEKGQRIRERQRHFSGAVETTILADTLVEYDAFGHIARMGLDVNANGTLDLGSADRITDTLTTYNQHESAWWRVVQTKTYPTANSSSAVQTSEDRERLSGLGAVLASEQVTLDIAGNATRRRVETDFSAKQVVTTTTYSDSVLPVVQVMRNGRMVSKSTKTTAAPVLYGYDALGRRVSVRETRHAQASSFTYHAVTGQLISQSDAAGNSTSFTYYGQGESGAGQTKVTTDALGHTRRIAYDLLGRMTHQWGTSVHPQACVYTAHGELQTLTTWRDTGSANLDSTSWPALTGGDPATWVYQSTTGLLTRKEYADGKGNDYTYDKFNRLATRKWARAAGGSALVTGYGYDPVTGELAQVDYSDATPDFTMSYDRLGRVASVTDVTGVRSFAYDPVNLRLLSETLPAYFGDRVLSRDYQDVVSTVEPFSVPGRASGYQLGVAGNPDRDLDIGYEYDSAGRFHRLTSPAGSYVYSYVPDSDLIGGVSGPAHTASRSYEPNRDVIDTIENKVGSITVSKYDYTANAMGQRTVRSQSGTAFTHASSDTFGYNARSEVVSATNSAQSSLNRSFVYDQIGNRLSVSSASGTTSYTGNILNQYTQVSGFGSQPSYDYDGNQIDTGRGATCSWDAENRLVGMEPLVPVSGDKKMVNTYDYLSRRVRRQIFTYVSGVWSLAADEKFIYDGWNVIAVLGWNSSASAFALTKLQTWGLDLSGAFQGAGGVGGLLAVSEIANSQISNSYHYLYDANGNVCQLVNGSGTVAAHYEYDAFGGSVTAGGAYASANEYRFSTKPLDAVGLYYYGFRFYDPMVGRWMSRDPIEEKGGTNLYGAADNDLVNKYDVLGQIFGLDFDYTQNLQIGGCIAIPGVPLISVCLTGGYSVTIDECCVPGEGEKQLITVSGDINLYAAIQMPSPFTFSYTKGAVITREGRPPDCPQPGGGWNGNVWVGFNAGFLNGQCTYDGGAWSCSVSSQFFPQWNVYGGGTLSITKTIVQ